MDIIVIFDICGYGGRHTLVDAVAVPNGRSEQETFDAWIAERSKFWGTDKERASKTHEFLSTTLRQVLDDETPPSDRMSQI